MGWRFVIHLLLGADALDSAPVSLFQVYLGHIELATVVNQDPHFHLSIQSIPHSYHPSLGSWGFSPKILTKLLRKESASRVIGASEESLGGSAALWVRLWMWRLLCPQRPEFLHASAPPLPADRLCFSSASIILCSSCHHPQEEGQLLLS